MCRRGASAALEARDGFDDFSIWEVFQGTEGFLAETNQSSHISNMGCAQIRAQHTLNAQQPSVLNLDFLGVRQLGIQGSQFQGKFGIFPKQAEESVAVSVDFGRAAGNPLPVSKVEPCRTDAAASAGEDGFFEYTTPLVDGAVGRSVFIIVNHVGDTTFPIRAESGLPAFA